MERNTVIVSGAGPTGLTLAHELARRGVAVRIIEKLPEFRVASRGKAGIQPRTLEVFHDLGIIDKILESGTQRLPFRRFRRDQMINETIPYLDNTPTSDRPFRRLHFMPQSRVEEILRERIAELGVTVELGTELVGFRQDAHAVTARLAGPGGTEEVTAAYLVGCDGGRSFVRKTLGVAFEGYTEDHRQIMVGDVEVDGLVPDAWYQWLDLDCGGVVMLCPLSGTRSWQIQATPVTGPDGDVLPTSVEAFQAAIDTITGMPIRVRSASWLSTSRVNVRMADQLRVGRIFLAGDAAHVHPVLGALGANTGVQDAYNLGWKLAVALRGGDPALLDTYQEERLPVAAWTLKTSVASSDAVFQQMMHGNGGAEAGLTQETLQLDLHYRDSSLSRSLAEDCGVRAGDRAPDAPCLDMAGRVVRLFDVFRGPHFTLLGFGESCAPALRAVDAAGITGVRTCLLGEHPAAYQLAGDTLVLVRPDGYVGLTAPGHDGDAVLGYLGAVLDGTLPAVAV